jgi:hypothetical protein
MYSNIAAMRELGLTGVNDPSSNSNRRGGHLLRPTLRVVQEPKRRAAKTFPVWRLMRESVANRETKLIP